MRDKVRQYVNPTKIQTNPEYRAAAQEEAEKILKERGDDPEVRRQVAALLGSIGDTMSDIAVFHQLQGLNSTGKAFREVYATNVEGLKRRA